MIGLTLHEQDLAALSPARRAEFLAGLAALGAFYQDSPAAPVPDFLTLTIKISGNDRQEKIEAVLAVARALGVTAGWQDGCFIAARAFGPLTVEAHYTPAQVVARSGTAA